MDYFELRELSRHRDIGAMAQKTVEFESKMIHVHDELGQHAHQDLMDMWQVVSSLC
jgi:hypothetical protein